MKTSQNNLISQVIAFIWLPHVVGIIGISLGFQEWFVQKTVLNLIASFGFFALYFPVQNRTRWMLFGLFFLSGMTVEWLGVHYGLFFGDYSYGVNLGPKIDGIPLIIGVFWAVLTFITARIAKAILPKKTTILIVAAFGALLMVALDLLLELLAPHFDYWTFNPIAPPLENYISWWAFGFVFQLILLGVEKDEFASDKDSLRVSTHIYLAQALFFGALALFR
jgi:putative membrane protein